MKANCFVIILLTFCIFSGYAQTKELKWRFNFSGGMGYQNANTSKYEKDLIDAGFKEQKVKDLYNDFKWGAQGNADVHYLVNKNFGIGCKYIFFTTDGKIEETWKMPHTSGYSDLTVNFKNRDYVNYVGTSVHVRTFLNDNKTLLLSATLSGGYTHYRSHFELKRNQPPTTLYNLRLVVGGKTFGTYTGAGLEHFLNKQISIGLDAGYFYSALSKITLERKIDKIKISQEINLKELNGTKENISRFDFSLGIKFYL
jgi:hypothetical protein